MYYSFQKRTIADRGEPLQVKALELRNKMAGLRQSFEKQRKEKDGNLTVVHK